LVDSFMKIRFHVYAELLESHIHPPIHSGRHLYFIYQV